MYEFLKTEKKGEKRRTETYIISRRNWFVFGLLKGFICLCLNPSSTISDGSRHFRIFTCNFFFEEFVDSVRGRLYIYTQGSRETWTQFVFVSLFGQSCVYIGDVIQFVPVSFFYNKKYMRYPVKRSSNQRITCYLRKSKMNNCSEIKTRGLGRLRPPV